MWYLALWKFIKINKKLLIIVGIILLIVGTISFLSIQNTNLKSDKEKNEATILTLQREVMTLKRDTAHYRKTLTELQLDRIRLKKINKEANKGLSSEYPSVEQIKNNPR